MLKEEFYYDSRDKKSKVHAIKWEPEGEIKFILQIFCKKRWGNYFSKGYSSAEKNYGTGEYRKALLSFGT